MRKNTSVNKPKPKSNVRNLTTSINKNEKNLKTSNKNTILNYVEKPSTSNNSRITRQNKRQINNSDENNEEIKEPPKRTKNAKFEPKKFLDVNRYIKNVEAGRNIDVEKIIPDNLEDLPSDNEEDKKLGELGREIDCIVSSEHVKRLHADNELFIEFNYFNYENIGFYGKVFSIKNPENLVKKFKTNGNDYFSNFELIFFSTINSNLRSALLQNFHSVAFSDGIKISFDNFMTLICYIFQIKPSKLKIAKNVEDLLERIYNLLDEEKPVENVKEIWAILHENIYCFFDCFTFLNFTHWNNEQIISLFCLFCQLYFDKELINFRYFISNSIKLLIKQLFSDDENRLNSILYEFCSNKLLEGVDGNIGRTFELFSLFGQFEQFNQFKLSTFQSILLSISSTNNYSLNSKPSLGQVLSFLPSTVKKLKLNKRYTDLYFIYTRFVDELTIDKNLLQKEEEKSLEMAEKYFRDSSLFLNKRNINDKMIDLWSRSLHRIREILQNIRNSAPTLPDSKLLENQQKWQPTALITKSDSIWSSSDEEEEDNNENK
ncbi:hypothetical protein ACQ4LE_004714 [Meloidogyne hapla]